MKLIPMTLRGAQKLREELELLKTITRPKIIAAITEARKHGDLKENAEYHSVREQQGFCEARIKNIETKLSYAQIIDITKIKNINHVTFGATVTVLNLLTYKTQTYCIVGDDEANIKEKLISINSPIARGLISKKINEIATISTPKGEVKYKITKIQFI